ncbi:MAG: hypothetical protein ACOCVL_03790, partial [Candidatus Sumerlaeota bacterium]
MHDALSRRGAIVNLLASVILLALAASVVLFYSDTILSFFFHNRVLNSIILAVFTIGVFYALVSIMRTQREFRVLEIARKRFGAGKKDRWIDIESQPQLPKSQVAERLEIYALQARNYSPPDPDSHIEKVDLTFGLRSSITRYVAGLLVFLGLLGTFIGLLSSIEAITSIIGEMNPESGDNIQNFLEKIKTGIQAPLMGMGIAFSTSIFGLVTSLIMGFLHLQLVSANTRYMSRLEAIDSAIFRP